MSLTLEERVDFIQNLDIGPGLQATERATENQPFVTAAGDSASVDAGSGISFVGNLTDVMKADVLNSVLLAQLAANVKFDRQKQTTQWYDYYKTVLENVGWVVQSFDFAKLSDVNSYFSVDNLLLKLAAAYLSGGELELFKQMIQSLKDSKNAAATKILDSSAKSVNRANFQVGVASNAQGNAMFKIGAYTYDASQNIDKVIFFTFGSQKVEFFAGSQSMVLNDNIYSKVRQIIIDKLGDRAKDFLSGIKLD